MSVVLSPPRTRFERFFAPAGWALVIFVLSSFPGDMYPDVRVPFADKIVHAFLYGPLGFWLARAFMHLVPTHPTKQSRHAIAFAVGAVYGLLDEIHQLYVPNRTFSLADWATDCVALAVGICLWHSFFAKSRVRN